MMMEEANRYKKIYDFSNLRPLSEVKKLLKTETDSSVLRRLRLEKRWIFLDMFWNNKIDFEMFSKLIKGEAIWLE